MKAFLCKDSGSSDGWHACPDDFGHCGGYSVSQFAAVLIKILENSVTAFVALYLLWLPLEAGFLTATGTTPGKWVFGIRVVKSQGQKLAYPEALKRAFLVWVQGEGLGIPVVILNHTHICL